MLAIGRARGKRQVMQLVRTFDRFDIGSQVYHRVGEQPHERKDGRFTIVVTWQSVCASCDNPFTFVRPDRPAPTWPPRRCKACAALDVPPGQPRRQGRAKLNRSVQPLPISAPDFVHGMRERENGHVEPRTDALHPDASGLRSPPPADAPPAVARPQPPHGPTTSTRKPATGTRKGVFTDK